MPTVRKPYRVKIVDDIGGSRYVLISAAGGLYWAKDKDAATRMTRVEAFLFIRTQPVAHGAGKYVMEEV